MEGVQLEFSKGQQARATTGLWRWPGNGVMCRAARVASHLCVLLEQQSLGDLVQAPESSPLTFSSHVFSSTYKDSNTLHLPTERFSPVRRFSDGAASIQAFKAHLEKLANSSSIKQLQQVMGEAAGTSGEAWGTQSNSAWRTGVANLCPVRVEVQICVASSRSFLTPWYVRLSPGSDVLPPP